jgi:hypothetical protein
LYCFIRLYFFCLFQMLQLEVQMLYGNLYSLISSATAVHTHTRTRTRYHS